MRKLVLVAAAIMALVLGVAADAYAASSSSSGGSRSSGGSSSSSRPSSSGGSSGGSRATPSSPGGTGRTASPSRPSTGPKSNPPAARIVPPPRTIQTKNGPVTVPPSGLRVPPGRNWRREQAFLNSPGGARYLDPYNSLYYGYASSPYHYWYLWALFHNPACNPDDDGDDDCPQRPQHYEDDGGCNSIGLLPLGLFGFGPTGAAWMWSRRRRRQLAGRMRGDS